MRSSNRVPLMALLFVGSTTFAEPMIFNPKAGADCSLIQQREGKWVRLKPDEIEEADYDGRPVELTAVAGGNKFKSFNINGEQYAAKRECFTRPIGSSDSELSPDDKSFFVELRGRKAILLGEGADGATQTDTATGVAATTSKYTTPIGIGARVGYHLNSKNSLFLDLMTLSGEQSATYSGSVTGTAKSTEQVIRVGAGYLAYFGDGNLRPYSAVVLGLASFTGELRGTIAPGGTLDVDYSASVFSATAELGLSYALSKTFELLASFDYTYLSVDQATVDRSGSSGIAVGSKLDTSASYSHLGLSLGARAHF